MWPNPQETVDLVTFTEEILNGKLYFLCSVIRSEVYSESYQTSETRLFVEIVTGYKLTIFAKSSMLNVLHDSEYASAGS